MDENLNPKQQLVERLKLATNILVTVSTNPSVDQLAACIGLTLWLNKLGKHATAVFSGEVPSTLEFLQPEDTLEKNTDSLRDFIIALDKSKADKLRYKVEDRVVKIFITPYRTNLSADDLEFSQGDFNVDAVVALGVPEQQDLDNAITAHGRILHDATVMSVNTTGEGSLGSINWKDPSASSLCELVIDLGQELGRDQLDGQIATALLTGIVAETERFSNEKTTPQTMSVSAELMSAGANQQLVASKLEGTSVPLRDAEAQSEDDAPSKEAANDDGTLEIGHARADGESEDTPAEPPVESSEDENETPAPESTPQSELPEDEEVGPVIGNGKGSRPLIVEPPTLGGTLTANSTPERPEEEPATDPLSLPQIEDAPLLSHDAKLPTTPDTDSGVLEVPPAPLGPPPQNWQPPAPLENAIPPVEVPEPTPVVDAVQPSATAPEASETLTELEQSVDSPHLAEEQATPQLDATKLDSARTEVESALSSAPLPTAPEPVEALNAQPIHLDLPVDVAPPSTSFDPTAFGVTGDIESSQPTPQPLIIPGAKEQPSAPQPVAMPANPDAAPPVPPPLDPSVYMSKPTDGPQPQ